MKNRFLFIIFLVIINVSCSQKEQKTGNLKRILLQKTKDIQPISSFISDVDYIELSYPANINPGKIELVKLLNKEFIVKQKYAGTTSILRFSSDGEFINKIGNEREVQSPRDIIIYNDDYAVWGETGVYVFSKNGEFQQKILNISKSGNRFFNSENNFYFFNELGKPGYLSEYSASGKAGKVFHPVQKEFENAGYSIVEEITQNYFHLFSPLIDTVYSFSNKKLTPQYIIEGDVHPTYIELLKKVGDKSETEKNRYINNNQHWIVTDYLENSDYIFIVYRLGSYPFNLIIRKSDWQTSYIKEFVNDIDGGVWEAPSYLSDDNKLYIPLASYQISGHKMLNKKRHGFDEQMEKAQENDNPVLMVCTIEESN